MTIVAETEEPFANTQASSIVEGGQQVYLLVGTLVEQEQRGGQPSFHLLAGERLGPALREPLITVLKRFNTARTAAQVRQWLAWAGAPAGLLDGLLKSRLIVKVNAVSGWKAAKSLRGFRLVPTSYIDLESQVAEGLVAVKRTLESRRDTAIAAELAEVLWGKRTSEDVPTAIAALSRDLAVDRETVARFVLTDVPMLVDYGFARLEPLYV